MKRWEMKDENGNEVTEDDINWSLVQDRAISLKLNNDGQIITLPNNMEYIQGKTASAFLGSEKIQIESRFLGFKLGKSIVKVRVNEKTNDISIEVENDPNHISDSK